MGYTPSLDNKNVSDKRLISAYIAESGNNCTLELNIFYEDLKGTNIEVATQSTSDGFSPVRNIQLQEGRDSTHGK